MNKLIYTPFCQPNLFSLLFGIALLINLNSVKAQNSADGVRLAAESKSPLGLTVEDAYGKVFLFDYDKFADGTIFKMKVTVKPNEITWHELWEGGRLETDQTQTIKLDDHSLMISFTELDGSFIVVYANFKSGETSFCGLIAPGETDETLCFTGTMSLTK